MSRLDDRLALSLSRLVALSFGDEKVHAAMAQYGPGDSLQRLQQNANDALSAHDKLRAGPGDQTGDCRALALSLSVLMARTLGDQRVAAVMAETCGAATLRAIEPEANAALGEYDRAYLASHSLFLDGGASRVGATLSFLRPRPTPAPTDDYDLAQGMKP